MITEFDRGGKNATPVPDAFIDEFLPGVKEPLYVLVYILALRYYSVGLPLSVKDAAFKLGVSEREVTDAWDYWRGQGIISLPDGDYGSIEFLDIKKKQDEPARSVLNAPAAVLPEITPVYTPAEFEQMKAADGQVTFLFSVAEKMLAKPLTYTELSTLLSFYDWLKLPVPVIEVMLDYCISNGHKSMRYLEKVAMSWADEGIQTVEEAELYIKTFNTDYREIMKAFGHNRRDPSPKEAAYMKKWLKQFKMPVSVVCEACGKTILQTGQPKFAYADAIITKWHDAEVRTLEAVAALEDEFYKNIDKTGRAAKTGKTPSAGASGAKAKSRFHNYEPRKWDYDKLLELEQAHLDKKIQS